MTDRPLTDLQVQILDALETERKGKDRALTPNHIGMLCGVEPRPGGQYRSRGPGSIIAPALTGLRRRGFVGFGRREDGLSGTAYTITRDGSVALWELQNP